ncbi:hypothetical protein Tco_1081014 [Tanacetum coccineum]|uniref:Gag-Pol polyprotein n=1 Tax=Tanacetum coccineum TaxID=301880 RepID=A0ABQ5HWH6_9ASTR
MTTPILTANNNSQMHNDIMAAEEAVPAHTETYKNTIPEKRAYFDAEAEAIHLILTGIGDDIYSTIDACTTTTKMWITIERLQQGESLNQQDVKTNLFWEFGKFTSRDGESNESYYSRLYNMMNEMVRKKLKVATMQVNVQFLQQLQPEWSRFVTVFKQTVDLDKESYHKLFGILKQYQNEFNEIRAEKLAKNANPLALVVAAQHYLDTYYQAPKYHKSYAPPAKPSSSTRSHATTRTKSNEIAKPITPSSESASEEDEDSDPKQAQRDKDMQKNLALIAKYIKNIYKPTNNNLRTSSNTKNKNVDTFPRHKNEIRLEKDYAYHKEKMLLCKQIEKGVPLRIEQGDWLDDNDDEPDEQELEAHYLYLANIQEVPTTESGPIFDVERLEHVDQNTDDKEDEIQKKLKREHESLTHELNECKSALAESNDICDRCRSALHNQEIELEKYKKYKDCQIEKGELECKLKASLD